MTNQKTQKTEDATAKTEGAAIKPGDILDGSASGRGDSVHVFFYQVVAATSKTVSFREIGKKLVSENSSGRGWEPEVGNFTSPPKRRKIQFYHGYPSVEVSRGTEGMLWDGKPVHSHTDDRA